MTHFNCLSRGGKAEMLRNGPVKFEGPFPKNAQNRSFQPAWFERFPWIEYNVANNSAQCFQCKLLAPAVNKNDEFRSRKVTNWKNLIEKAPAEHKRCGSTVATIIEADSQQQETLRDKIVKASDAAKA